MGFGLPGAIDALNGNGLLAGVLVPSSTGLRRLEPGAGATACADQDFMGAGLDSRNLPDGALFVALAGSRVDGRAFAPAALQAGHWVLTRDLEGEDPLLEVNAAPGSGVLLCSDPEAALGILGRTWRQELGLPVLGITGTNGKTTTKDLARAMLSAAGPTQATPGNFNNQLGLPLTLLNIRPGTRFAVIEMGASAVGDIRYLAGLARPDVGIITNASAAHLSEFGSLENIVEGKGELVEGLPTGGTAVLNVDSPGYGRWRDRAACPVISWGRDEGDHRWLPVPEQQALELDGEIWPVPLPGAHNAANLCAAVLACRALGVEDEVLRRGLATFSASDHRSRLLTWKGRTVLDDAYNANPGSMCAAAESLQGLPAPGRRLAILGRMAELGEDSERLHRETGTALAALGLDALVAVGEEAALLAAGFGIPAGITLGTCQEALTWLKGHSEAGDVILVKGSRSAAMEDLVRLMEEEEGER